MWAELQAKMEVSHNRLALSLVNVRRVQRGLMVGQNRVIEGISATRKDTRIARGEEKQKHPEQNKRETEIARLILIVPKRLVGEQSENETKRNEEPRKRSEGRSTSGTT